MADPVAIMGDALPMDHADQVTLGRMLAEHLAALAPGRSGPDAEPLLVLDLGCGDGRAIAEFERGPLPVAYLGIDIERSPEVDGRRRADPRLLTYDGVNLPFPDASFDLVHSRQVLEHVRRPEALMAEVRRVLAPEGMLPGSVSFLEPYHSFSIFNWSPWGLNLVLREAGLTPVWLRPGLDGTALILRTTFRGRRIFSRWFDRPSPLNRFHDFRARRRGWDARHLNAAKLETAGHIVFAARRPPE